MKNLSEWLVCWTQNYEGFSTSGWKLCKSRSEVVDLLHDNNLADNDRHTNVLIFSPEDDNKILSVSEATAFVECAHCGDELEGDAVIYYYNGKPLCEECFSDEVDLI